MWCRVPVGNTRHQAACSTRRPRVRAHAANSSVPWSCAVPAGLLGCTVGRLDGVWALVLGQCYRNAAPCAATRTRCGAWWHRLSASYGNEAVQCAAMPSKLPLGRVLAVVGVHAHVRQRHAEQHARRDGTSGARWRAVFGTVGTTARVRYGRVCCTLHCQRVQRLGALPALMRPACWVTVEGAVSCGAAALGWL